MARRFPAELQETRRAVPPEVLDSRHTKRCARPEHDHQEDVMDVLGACAAFGMIHEHTHQQRPRSERGLNPLRRPHT